MGIRSSNNMSRSAGACTGGESGHSGWQQTLKHPQASTHDPRFRSHSTQPDLLHTVRRWKWRWASECRNQHSLHAECTQSKDNLILTYDFQTKKTIIDLEQMYHAHVTKRDGVLKCLGTISVVHTKQYKYYLFTWFIWSSFARFVVFQ